MEEALSGLPGIASLKADLKKDRFHVSYDPERVTPEQMLETIREQGFQGEIVKGAPEPASIGNKQRDLARLPGDLQEVVQKARREGKPLLLAFHGPG